MAPRPKLTPIPIRSLLDILRGQFGIIGAHFGCGANECGACNVIVGDRAVAACDTPLWSVADKDVMTVEGLGNGEQPHPLQRAFIAEQALQCGYCVSGILMSAAALLKRNPSSDGRGGEGRARSQSVPLRFAQSMVRAVLRAAARWRRDDRAGPLSVYAETAGEPRGEPETVVVGAILGAGTGRRCPRERWRSGKAS